MKWVLGIIGIIWKGYIGIVFFITAFLFYPIIVPFLNSDKGRIRAFQLFKLWGRTVQFFLFYFIKRINKPQLPDEPFIIISNHSSYLDIFLMYSLFPKNRFLFLGKSEILKYPLIRTYFKKFNIPVYRSNPMKAAKSLIAASREVKKGWSLVIFPEGGIPDNNPPKMNEFKDGAFQLAKNVKVPIVPITFVNNYRLFSDPSFTFGSAYPGVSEVIFHEIIPVETVKELSQDELKEKCFDIINGPILERFPHFKE